MDRRVLIGLIADRFSAQPGHLWARAVNQRDAPVRTRTARSSALRTDRSCRRRCERDRQGPAMVTSLIR